MEVSVSIETGEQYTIELEEDETIRSLKQRISIEILHDRVPSSAVVLRGACGAREDHIHLRDLAVSDGDYLPITYSSHLDINTPALYEGHTDVALSLAASPCGKYLYSGSADHTARVWNTQTEKCVVKLNGHTMSVYSIAASGCGRYVYTGAADGTVRIWTTAAWVCEAVLSCPAWVLSIVVCDASSLLYSCCNDGAIRVWDVERRELVKTVRDCDPRTSALSPCGGKLFTVSVQHVDVWETSGFTKVGSLVGHAQKVNRVAVSYSGNMVASCSYDRTARLWDAETLVCFRVLSGHAGWVTSVVFCPDDRIVTCGGDGRVLSWQPTSERCEGIIGRRLYSWLTVVEVSPCGRYVFTSASDKKIHVENTSDLWELER